MRGAVGRLVHLPGFPSRGGGDFRCWGISALRCSSQWEPGGGVRFRNSPDPRKTPKDDGYKEGDNVMDFDVLGRKKKSIMDDFFYSDRAAGRGYSDYIPHLYQGRKYVWPPHRGKATLLTVIVVGFLVVAAIDYDWAYDVWKEFTRKFRPEAATREIVMKSESGDDGRSGGGREEGEKKKKRKKMGFRERRIVEYENRIRTYSTPDKIFRYFATLKMMGGDDKAVRTNEIFMTPEDFVRAITPGVMQPRKLGLDKFLLYDPEKHRHDFSDKKSIFYKLGEHGLISFSDYLFLVTLLSNFSLAFRIFDLNGDGELDIDEFERVQELIMSQTTVAQRHRGDVIPPVYSASSTSGRHRFFNSALSSYFFGSDGERKLSIETFLDFQSQLHRDVLRIEFERRDPESKAIGRISESAFADLLLMHAGLSEKRQKRMMKRVKKKYGKAGGGEKSEGVSFDEVSAFFRFLYHIEDVDLALYFYKMAGASIDGDLLKTVARKVAKQSLSDAVVGVVITLFDEDEDGELLHKEFVSIMRNRMKRGLERARDTGLVKLLNVLVKCSAKQVYSFQERG